MSNKLLVDAGENYEYVRTIVENKVELAKIDLAEKTSAVVGSFVLYTVLSVIGVMFFVTLLIMLAVYLSTVFGSVFIGIAASSGILLLVGIAFYYFRKVAIYNPITNVILNNIVEIKK